MTNFLTSLLNVIKLMLHLSNVEYGTQCNYLKYTHRSYKKHPYRVACFKSMPVFNLILVYLNSTKYAIQYDAEILNLNICISLCWNQNCTFHMTWVYGAMYCNFEFIISTTFQIPRSLFTVNTENLIVFSHSLKLKSRAAKNLSLFR